MSEVVLNPNCNNCSFYEENVCEYRAASKSLQDFSNIVDEFPECTLEQAEALNEELYNIVMRETKWLEQAKDCKGPNENGACLITLGALLKMLHIRDDTTAELSSHPSQALKN